mmetsp:Transcript_110761/g.352866  ORF Transcript_110761/g.352866 Transcript_110761/m.352866 type:complete len:863 (+) Transcript_110761:120-2708(+)
MLAAAPLDVRLVEDLSPWRFQVQRSARGRSPGACSPIPVEHTTMVLFAGSGSPLRRCGRGPTVDIAGGVVSQSGLLLPSAPRLGKVTAGHLSARSSDEHGCPPPPPPPPPLPRRSGVQEPGPLLLKQLSRHRDSDMSPKKAAGCPWSRPPALAALICPGGGSGICFPGGGSPTGSCHTPLNVVQQKASAGSFSGPRASRMRLGLLLLGWGCCVVFWVMGAFLNPSLEVNVMMGTRFHRTITRSLMGTLQDMLHHKMWFCFVMLGFFSLVVPAVKLTSTFVIICRLFCSPVHVVHRAHKWTIWALSALASYQLIDLYVGVLVVAFFNSDSSEAEVLPGFYWFFAYCMLSLLCSELLAGLFHERTSFNGESPRFRSLPTSAPDAVLEERRSSRGHSASPTCAAGHAIPPASPSVQDVGATFFFTLCFGLLLWNTTRSPEPLLEVRAMWHGVALDRRAYSADELLRHALPKLTGPFVATSLVMMNVVFPLLYALVLLASCCLSTTLHEPSGGGLCKRSGDFCTVVGDALRPWATADVLALSMFIFLFTVQDQHTLTIVPDGSYGFLLLLGAGLAFFFLRWLVWRKDDVVHIAEWRSVDAPSGRFLLLIAAWLAVSLVAFRGVPGSAPHFEFPTLDSVCAQVLPLLDRTIQRKAPAAFGDCQNTATAPPQPCKGDTMLVDSTTDSGFVQVPWVAGLNTIHFDKCHLLRDSVLSDSRSALPSSEYHLTVGGVFKHLNLFLHVKKCGPFGQCTNMNSADHCCGDDIRFQLRFSMGCKPGQGAKVSWNISLESCDIDPMLVEKSLVDQSWVQLNVAAVDISPRVEKAVKSQLSKFIDGAEIFWAGRDMHVPELLNQLISYNSPSHVGEC